MEILRAGPVQLWSALAGVAIAVHRGPSSLAPGERGP
jgi:hypothetical protein